MRKSKVLFLCAVMISLAALTGSAFLTGVGNDTSEAAYDVTNFVYGDFTYDIDTGTDEAKLIKYNANADTVAIPSTVTYSGDDYDITVIGIEAFNQKGTLTNLTMGDNVKVIESKAFRETGITSLNLKNVTHVGDQAFLHCINLTTLTAPALEEIGVNAFAILDIFNGAPYEGPIPKIANLNLPVVKKIGAGAFGTMPGNSLARDFGNVVLPEVTEVGNYAFAKAKITGHVEMPLVETVGLEAFYLDASANADTAAAYPLELEHIKSIGNNAFEGRAIDYVTMPATSYTIGNYAFQFTELTEANLGMVSSIGAGAFDKIDTLRYFRVDAANTKYASFISDNTASKDVRGALYEIDSNGKLTLLRMPPEIKPLLADYNNTFIVANGATEMANSAFHGCPSIIVDLNDIKEVPFSAFANTNVVGVIANNVEKIGVGAFNSCGALASFEFLTTGGNLEIGQLAFTATRIGEISLPEKTVVFSQAFSSLASTNVAVGIWADIDAADDAFEGTVMSSFRVSSDDNTDDEAKEIFDDWNDVYEWTYKGSDRVPLLIIDNHTLVDISGLTPGKGRIEVKRTIEPANYEVGNLQFVEYKGLKVPPFHMQSIKAGIYDAETHSDSQNIMPTVTGTGTPVGQCWSGDGRTWELIQEYYQINFYSLTTESNSDGDGFPDGVDTDFILSAEYLNNIDISRLTHIEDRTYLAGKELKDLLWQDFVRYSLDGWYAGKDITYTGTGQLDLTKKVTTGSMFGNSASIPEAWIYRDPTTDQGILYLYGVFVGKEYNIQLESRLTGGQTNQGSFNENANSTGGKIELWIGGAPNISTVSAGFNENTYPYGTNMELRAIPNSGYAFVGWGVADVSDENNPSWKVAIEKDDRSLVTSGGTAVWSLELPQLLKFVAYFAKTDVVTFDYNDGTTSDVVRTYVVGDRLVEANNDYNGRDYLALFEGDSEDSDFTGNGTSYYPGTPDKTTLDFDGWYASTAPYTLYAKWNGTNLTDLRAMPNSSLTLKAKWFATVTFYSDDGIRNTPTGMTGAGLTPLGDGVYTYKHDVGNYTTGGNYDGSFSYGAGTPPTYTPTITDVQFQGWYVLSGKPATTPTIADVEGGTTGLGPYDDKKRFVPGSTMNGHTYLLALYATDVDFYFNGATGIDSTVSATTLYRVIIPASEATPTTFGSNYFSTISTAMLPGGNTYKHDLNEVRMDFVGWFPSTDGTTSPTEAEKPNMYVSTTEITKNEKLIAGWGVNVMFTDAGVVGTIDDDITHTEWVPGGYGFTILEGESFNPTGPGMPKISVAGISPRSWFDADTAPYTWYNESTVYTYSVRLTPEFRQLFEFNMMGGTPGVVYVAYDANEDFDIVLGRLHTSLRNPTDPVHLELEKTDLYYSHDGSSRIIGDEPNALWYRGETGYGKTPDLWTLDAEIGPDPSKAIAYIKWLATVKFDVNVPTGDIDAGTAVNQTTITEVEEGTPFEALLSPPATSFGVPDYDTDKSKSFKGWFAGTTRYTDPSGVADPGAPNVTANIGLVATWGIEVKFYYTGTTVPSSIPNGSQTGNDPGIGDYVIIDVTGTTVPRPSLTNTGFTINHLLWYEEDSAGVNGFDRTDATINVVGFSSSTGTTSFDWSEPITVNKTVYARWYADVIFNLGSSSSASFFGTTTKYLLEGSDLDDLAATGANLNPYVGDSTKSNWKFVGWYDSSAAAPGDYEDLGLQYYRTDFDYTTGGTLTPGASQSIDGDVRLYYDFVVEVDFDPNYAGSTSIASKYLRVEMPLPDDAGLRFTPKPPRSGVTFMGWVDLADSNKRYTASAPSGTDAPDTAAKVINAMKLTAIWEVRVSFLDLPQYLTDGLMLNISGTTLQDPGTDGVFDTIDDSFTMPDGTTLRQFILADPSMPGKEFISWFEEKAGITDDGLFEAGDQKYELNGMLLGDVKLSAGYGFRLSFNTNGGTPATVSDILVIEGQSVNLPDAPAKRRLTFTGWNDGSADMAANGLVTPTVNTAYTAKWEVVVTVYDGISMTPIAIIKWDEAAGPASVGLSTTELITDSDYGGGVTSFKLTYVDPVGTQTVTVEKFVDRYDPADYDYDTYYSVFNGWFDPYNPFTEITGPMIKLEDMFASLPDSRAVFATWTERLRVYDFDNNQLGDDMYVDSGEYIGTLVANSSRWADSSNPTTPLKLDNFRIRDSMDLRAIKDITVTFDANGGTPATPSLPVIAGTMLGMIPVEEPTRLGQYFAGWYAGSVKYSFTDKLTDDITLTARWQSTPVTMFTVFASADNGANITPRGMIKVMSGDSLTFNYNAPNGSKAMLRIDGTTVTDGNAGGTYTFTNIRYDRSIEVLVDNTGNPGDPGNPGNPEDPGTDPIIDPEKEPIWGHDGDFALLNLICMVLSVVFGVIAIIIAFHRNYEGSGKGRILRIVALIAAVIAVILFFLTQAFNGSYVMYDSWSIVMVILSAIGLISVLLSMRYDFNETEDGGSEGGVNEEG